MAAWAMAWQHGHGMAAWAQHGQGVAFGKGGCRDFTIISASRRGFRRSFDLMSTYTSLAGLSKSWHVALASL